MPYTLVITEKPNVSRRLAASLAEGPFQEEKKGQVSDFKLTHKGKEIVVVSAVGHLFGLKQEGTGWNYPVFDIKWAPTFEIDKGAQFSKPYYQKIKKLAADADDFVVATDYDVEGELIGHNILNHLCPEGSAGKAKRMKFSTLTKEELINKFENLTELDFPLAYSGEARHKLDWFYGINISRALTHAIRKASGNFLTMSTGRVQGPSLKILVDREREIKAFVPEAYFQIELKFDAEGKPYSAWHEADKFKEKEAAEVIISKCRGKEAKVDSIKKKEFKHNPPVPFDLTTLQIEAYRVFGYKPKYTQQLAQTLYEMALISYPRTAAQEFPPGIDLKKVLQSVQSNPAYSALASEVLKGKLEPTIGKGKDPAHPPIHPTGEIPKGLEKQVHQLYDLIVKRFLAIFGKPAIRETVTAKILIEGESFISKGSRTVEKNWHVLYSPYVELKEEEIPDISENDILKVLDLLLHEKETKPPKRYTEASLIRQLDSLGLGTKSTRAQIITTLYDRNYISGKSIEVTELGMNIVSALEKHVPKIVEPELTRKIEESMESIRAKETTQEKVLENAKAVLTEVLDDFKKDELEIGNSLKASYIQTKKAEKTIGKCPKCEDGEIRIIHSKTTKKRFAGCSNYPKCSNGYPLPQKGLVKVEGKKCKECGLPMVKIINRGKRPWEMCIDPNCPSKKNWGKK
ncbi:DNA topoisomerase I [Candidatus Undinarchaeota archaeon]